MGLDLFRKSFDEGTRVKLCIYQSYLRQWLPTLIQSGLSKTLNLFDFFAGAGRDKDGQSGSPLLALSAVEEYANLLKSRGVKVRIYLNDEDKKKVEALKAVVADRMSDALVEVLDAPIITCESFETVFGEYLPVMKKANVANFLFLDQNGIREVTEPVFAEIVRLGCTDFMFFIASETFNRFGRVGRTQQHLDISPEQLMATQHNHIHRVVTGHYRRLIPKGEEYYIAPFSIKKPDTGNIYGLVFGSGHLAGLLKFMNVVWGLDSECGEANYDVDGENIDKGQGFLFDDMRKPTKLELFSQKLRAALEARKIATDHDLLAFALTNGFQVRHARKVFDDLCKEGILPKQKVSLDFNGRWKVHKRIKYD